MLRATERTPLLIAALLACRLSIPAFAGIISQPYLLQNGNIGITVDENCNGVVNGFLGPQAMPCGFQLDPGPGGLAHVVMTYGMLNPPGLVAGDVLLQEGVGGPIGDIIRFNPNQGGGSLVFYSDNSDGFHDGADSPGPSDLYPNNITILEIGFEGINGAFYTPIAGQPGFVNGAAAPVTYHFISDVPEPGSIILLASGGAALLFVRQLRRKIARVGVC